MDDIDEGAASNEDGLQEDELVRRLIPDPSKPSPDVVTVVGYLGKSPARNMWRVYLSPALDEYIEFAQEDIVETQSLKSDPNPLGGTVVWLKRGTTVRHIRTTSRQTQAEFLQGDISTRFMPGVSPILASRVGGGGYEGETLTICWPSWTDVCETETWRCSTIVSFCPRPNCPSPPVRR